MRCSEEFDVGLLDSYVTCTSAVKTEAVCSFKTLSTYNYIQRYNQKDQRQQIFISDLNFRPTSYDARLGHLGSMFIHQWKWPIIMRQHTYIWLIMYVSMGTTHYVYVPMQTTCYLHISMNMTHFVHVRIRRSECNSVTCTYLPHALYLLSFINSMPILNRR